jgi:hypothetical protein
VYCAGEAGLAEKAALLAAAIENNEREAPEALMRSLPIPATETIAFHPITSYTSQSATQPTGNYSVHTQNAIVASRLRSSDLVSVHR